MKKFLMIAKMVLLFVGCGAQQNNKKEDIMFSKILEFNKYSYLFAPSNNGHIALQQCDKDFDNCQNLEIFGYFSQEFDDMVLLDTEPEHMSYYEFSEVGTPWHAEIPRRWIIWWRENESLLGRCEILKSLFERFLSSQKINERRKNG